MALTDYPLRLRPFIFHGLNLEVPSDAEADINTDCLFCGAESKFYITPQSGQWYCHRCRKNGNIIVFLREVYERSLQATTDADITSLASDRSLPGKYLRQWGIVRHAFQGDYTVPAFNHEGKVVNLYRYLDFGDRRVLVPTATCRTQLLGIHQLNISKTGTLWFTEGVWDAMALSYMLDEALSAKPTLFGTKKTKHHVLAVPGANSFRREWAEVAVKRSCNICFDNDHAKDDGRVPGWEGTLKTASLLHNSTRKLKLLKWGENGYNPKIKDGFDIRDLLSKKSPLEACQYLKKKLVNPPDDIADYATTKDVVAIPRHSFKSLITDYQEELHVTQALQDTLAIMLAVCISTELPGDQLWFRIIGPPGTGKSTLAEALGANKQYTISRSMITGLHSGFTAGAKGKDTSLISIMDRKTLIIKDADTLMQQENKQRILSEFRDVYDGTSRAQYRTGLSKVYEDIKTTLILCGTDTLRNKKADEASLGERFLDCDCLPHDVDTMPYLESASQNALTAINSGFAVTEAPAKRVKNSIIRATTSGYIEYLKESVSEQHPPRVTVEDQQTLIQLSVFLSYMRLNVKMAGDSEDGYHPPRAELATRLVKQFTKLAVSLAYVLNKDSVDEEVFRIVRKVVIDSSLLYNYQLAQWMAVNGRMTIKKAAQVLNVSEQYSGRLLRRMHLMKILVRKTISNGSTQGRSLLTYRLSPTMRKAATVMFNVNK